MLRYLQKERYSCTCDFCGKAKHYYTDSKGKARAIAYNLGYEERIVNGREYILCPECSKNENILKDMCTFEEDAINKFNSSVKEKDIQLLNIKKVHLQKIKDKYHIIDHTPTYSYYYVRLGACKRAIQHWLDKITDNENIQYSIKEIFEEFKNDKNIDNICKELEYLGYKIV